MQTPDDFGGTGSGKDTWATNSLIVPDIAGGAALTILDAKKDALGLTSTAIACCNEFGRMDDLITVPYCGFNPCNLVPGDASNSAEAFNAVRKQADPGESAGKYYQDCQEAFINHIFPLFSHVYGCPIIPYELWLLCVRKDLREHILHKAGNDATAVKYYWGVEKRFTEQELRISLSGLMNFIDKFCSGESFVYYNVRNGITYDEIIQKKAVCIIREGGDPGSADHIRGLFHMAGIQAFTNRRQLEANPPFLAVYALELHKYVNLAFSHFVETARSTNTAMVGALQAISLLIDPVSKFDFTNDVLTSMRSIACLNGLTKSDAEYIQNQLKEEAVKYKGVSKKRSGAGQEEITISERYERESMMFADEIRHLSPDEVLLIPVKDRGIDDHRILENPKPFTLDKVPYVPPTTQIKLPETVWDNEPLNLAIDEILENARIRAEAKKNANSGTNRGTKTNTTSKKK